MTSYCDIAPGHPFHGPYHDREYGFPVRDDDRLFERLVLEINQAGSLLAHDPEEARGLQWRRSKGFEIVRVAAYGDEARLRLLADAGIIRNRLKVDAAIENARCIQALQASHGSFAAWLDAHHPRPHADWVKLFRAHFKFTGGEICREFLMSTGYLEGAHRPDCPVHAEILEHEPPWSRDR